MDTDISELDLPSNVSITFPKGKDQLMDFEISITPKENYYRGGTFVFTFAVPPVRFHTLSCFVQPTLKG